MAAAAAPARRGRSARPRPTSRSVRVYEGSGDPHRFAFPTWHVRRVCSCSVFEGKPRWGASPGCADQPRTTAAELGWTIVSMKNDRNTLLTEARDA